MKGSDSFTPTRLFNYSEILTTKKNINIYKTLSIDTTYCMLCPKRMSQFARNAGVKRSILEKMDRLNAEHVDTMECRRKNNVCHKLY